MSTYNAEQGKAWTQIQKQRNSTKLASLKDRNIQISVN